MHVPTKPAIRLKPGEYLVEKDGAMILSVAFIASRDLVTVKTAKQEHKFRLNDRVAALPRDE